MIPQEHTETIRPEEQAPFHVEGTPSWRTWGLWLRVLGVVVALAAGFAFAIPMDIQIPLEVFLLVPVLVGVVSAGLLRSWWALLVVPVAFSIGAMLSLIFQGQGIDLSSPEGVDIVMILGVLPTAIGTAIGTPIGKWIERRLQP